ncbi:uncharacterized protein F4812DRAFT_428209 [Daldinia caldariorum]|uniref:uncharacterized protein n=1 Tax=Daldinia caldariorum TaxID=326644 RepID=UPI002007BC88|nr:uncharacterized protein F4812DRAFT_428209 [Daldinia caldariorum]KAI1467940.1 hypothetical protein F4812DRAFT_428209 [Daldinia caldariorum]
MAEVGVIQPPPGVTPDFHSWTSLQTTIVVLFGVTFGIATILLVLRLYTAFCIVKKVDWDILFVIAAWGVSLTFYIGTIIAIPAGFGRHLWDVTPQQLQGYFKVLTLLALTYIWPPSLTKLALLVLYLRLNPSKLFHLCIYASGLLIITFTVVFSALFLGPCNPLSTGSGACLNNIAVAQAVLNIVSDVIIVVLPIPMIHGLKMPMKQKIAVGLLIAMGSAVVIVSIARVAYVRTMLQNTDVTWTQASTAVLSTLELNIGIIGNCLIRMKPLIQKHFPSWRSSGDNSNTPGSFGRNQSGNAPRTWGSGGGSHQRYKLDSIERGMFGDGTRGTGKDIYVANEYRVEYESNRSNQARPVKTGSTESILAAEG